MGEPRTAAILPDLATVLEEADVLVSAGSGGVGKTTTAASLALAAAERGRRVVVVTIDPARRLADALGIGDTGLTNDPRRIDGPWPGELWAAMLDTSATFDGVVRRHAPPAQAEEILANRFYRNLADSLSGTQEFMAAEKLYELHDDDRFDLVVVDTPPTRNALDFIEAPGTLRRFLDHRLYKLLVAPSRGMGRAVGMATGAFVRTVSRVVGSAVVEDAIEFFRAFDGLEDGFRDRADAVAAVLRDPRTAFVVVTSPRPEALEEAAWFVDQLRERSMHLRALIVNRVQPRPVDGPTDRFREMAAAHPHSDLAAFADLVVDQCERADIEREQLGDLVARMGHAPTVLVPILGGDVHDLAGLRQIATQLTA